MRHSARLANSKEAWACSLLEQLELSQHPNAQRLVAALSQTPRELFVDAAFAFRAYEDTALPIGLGQTISKPSTVLLTLAQLDVRPGDRVLEVGTGSGYVAALLAHLGASVVGIERHPELVQAARRRLSGLGYHDVLIRAGDGLRGWREFAPYDAVVISAAVKDVPRAILDQLAFDGRVVAPIAAPPEGAVKNRERVEQTPQRLGMWRMQSDATESRSSPQIELDHIDLGPCRFVLAA